MSPRAVGQDPAPPPALAARPGFFVGIDLALCNQHVVAVLDEAGRSLGRTIRFGHGFAEHQRMLEAVRERLPQDAAVQWAAETSGGVWLPTAAFLAAHGQSFVLQKATKVADLRDYHQRHLKTDPVDARTIAEATRLDCQTGRPLRPPTGPALQARRALSRRIEALHQEIGGAKNRLLSLLCHTLLPNLATSPHDWCAPSMLRVLHACPALDKLAQRSLNDFVASAQGPRKGGVRVSREALEALHDAARDSLRVYGPEGLDWATYAVLLTEAIQAIWDLQQRSAGLEQQLGEALEQDCSSRARAAALSVPGVGPHTLQQSLAFFGPPGTWAPFGALKQYGGLVPILVASGSSEAACVMSKLGEPIVRKFVYHMGNTARQTDAEFAACYFDHMVHKGKRHAGACIATGLRVLNVLRAVLRDERPYQPLHPETHQPIAPALSRQLARTRYRVPTEVRQRLRKRKHSDDAQPGGQMKDMPEALPVPPRSHTPSLC